MFCILNYLIADCAWVTFANEGKWLLKQRFKYNNKDSK